MGYGRCNISVAGGFKKTHVVDIVIPVNQASASQAVNVNAANCIVRLFPITSTNEQSRLVGITLTDSLLTLTRIGSTFGMEAITIRCLVDEYYVSANKREESVNLTVNQLSTYNITIAAVNDYTKCIVVPTKVSETGNGLFDPIVSARLTSNTNIEVVAWRYDPAGVGEIARVDVQVLELI